MQYICNYLHNNNLLHIYIFLYDHILIYLYVGCCLKTHEELKMKCQNNTVGGGCENGGRTSLFVLVFYLYFDRTQKVGAKTLQIVLNCKNRLAVINK